MNGVAGAFPPTTRRRRIEACVRSIAAWATARPGGRGLGGPRRRRRLDRRTRPSARAAWRPRRSSTCRRDRLRSPIAARAPRSATGVLASTGDPVLVSDADLSTPLSEWVKLAELLPTHPVAIGSRAIDEALVRRRQPLHRVLLGKLGNGIDAALRRPGIRDTQCGFKLFRRDAARSLFSRRAHRPLRLGRRDPLPGAPPGVRDRGGARSSGSTRPTPRCASSATRSRRSSTSYGSAGSTAADEADASEPRPPRRRAERGPRVRQEACPTSQAGTRERRRPEGRGTPGAPQAARARSAPSSRRSRPSATSERPGGPGPPRPATRDDSARPPRRAPDRAARGECARVEVRQRKATPPQARCRARTSERRRRAPRAAAFQRRRSSEDEREPATGTPAKNRPSFLVAAISAEATASRRRALRSVRRARRAATCRRGACRATAGTSAMPVRNAE